MKLSIEELKAFEDNPTNNFLTRGQMMDVVRELIAIRELKGEQVPVALTVWYGSMPESNGKENWTAILHRKGEGKLDGITIDRSEYPGRVLYAADRARYLIGEKQDRPNMLSYDSDKRSNYIYPVTAPQKPVVLPGISELIDACDCTPAVRDVHVWDLAISEVKRLNPSIFSERSAAGGIVKDGE